MCTAVISFDPHARFPVLLIGVRDEFVARPWRPPGRHWPDHPALIGGRDLQAGGTWLAVEPAAPRVACVLNGRGRPALEPVRRSRGELPLLAAAHGKLTGTDTRRLDPFHLLCAEPDGVRLWSWDGERIAERELAPGLHMVVNSGLAGTDTGTDAGVDAGLPDSERLSARVAYFRPRLESVPRPQPDAGDPPERAWGEWLALAEGDGLDPADPRALVVWHDFGGGRIWGTTSITLVALSATGARYDFAAVPGAWRTVLGVSDAASEARGERG